MGGGTTMLPDDLPEDMPSFVARFGSDEQCREYLFKVRWPDGFRCSACGHDDAYALRTKIVDECVACRKQHSLLPARSRRHQASQSVLGLRQVRLTASLPTAPRSSAARARR